MFVIRMFVIRMFVIRMFVIRMFVILSEDFAPALPGQNRSRRIPISLHTSRLQRASAHGTFPTPSPYNELKRNKRSPMFTFLLWCILFVICWPLALLALIAYPFIWLLLLPFRIVGIAVHGVLEIIYLAITLPFRLLAAPFRMRV
jgi:hypothetical protein